MVKCLLISGSPRKGNTDFILSKILEGIKGDGELILLKDKKIHGCTGCLSCLNRQRCIINDDMTEIMDKMVNSDIIIIGTPNYFGNVTGLLKDFMDRAFPLYKSKSLKNKKLFLIMVGNGDVKSSEKHLNEAMGGFIYDFELDLIDSYCFKAFYPDDVKQDPKSISKINEIIERINSL